MITIEATSLVIFGWLLYTWLLDNLLNSFLAKRLGDTKTLAYFIPIYGYYRFFVLIGMSRLWGVVAMIVKTAAIVIAYTMFFRGILIKHLFVVAEIIANAAINGFAATRFKKSKWEYIGISILFELMASFLEPIFTLVFLTSSPLRMFFYALLLLATIRQIAKIILMFRTQKALEYPFQIK